MTRGKSNELIFAEIGLDAEGIRRAVRGVARVPVIVKLPDDIQRPICLVCGRPVGKKTCIPTIQSWPPPLSPDERNETGQHSPLPSGQPE